MNLQRYPAQEPLSPLGAGYAQRVLPLGQRVHGIEVDHGSDPYQTLTVFPADRPSGDVLVFFHGGGWTNGYKEWMYFMAPALNAQGVTFVSAGYRLAPAHVFPAGQEDCADAVAWVLQHIGELPLSVRLVAESSESRDILKQQEETAGIPIDVSLECALGSIAS